MRSEHIRTHGINCHGHGVNNTVLILYWYCTDTVLILYFTRRGLFLRRFLPSKNKKCKKNLIFCKKTLAFPFFWVYSMGVDRETAEKAKQKT